MAEPFTDTDVELVAERLWKQDERFWPAVHRVSWTVADAAEQVQYRAKSVEILSALAAAGRLTPADAKREWTIAFRGTPITCLAGQIDEAGARLMVDNDQDGNVTAVSRWAGPWLPEERAPDRES